MTTDLALKIGALSGAYWFISGVLLYLAICFIIHCFLRVISCCMMAIGFWLDGVAEKAGKR